MRRFFIVLALILAPPFAAASGRKSPPTLVFEIKGSDLPGPFSSTSPQAFDLSPDGTHIAAAFETFVRRGEHTVWVAVWDVLTKKLLCKSQVEEPIATDELSVALSARDARYTPDGTKLIIQTGQHLLLLRSQDLSKVTSLGPMEIPNNSRHSPFIRRFDISRDGRWIAALTGVARDSRPITGVQLVDVSDGKIAAEWTMRDAFSTIALSEDGSKVLLSGFDEIGYNSGDVLLAEATTGKLLRSFRSSCTHLGACIASDARFWGSDRVVIVPKPATASHFVPIATALWVLDIHSGKLLQQLNPSEFLSTGSITIASNAPILMTVNAWPKFGFEHHKPELVAFNLINASSKTVVRPIGHGQWSNTVEQYSLRISSDGLLVAFFSGLKDNVVPLVAVRLAHLKSGKLGEPLHGNEGSLPPRPSGVVDRTEVLRCQKWRVAHSSPVLA